MTHIRPKLTPSGEIEANGVLYRLVETTDTKRYSVIRESDGQDVGSFAADPAGGHEPKRDDVASDALEPELVLAIARLMASPRGVLPIQ